MRSSCNLAGTPSSSVRVCGCAATRAASARPPPATSRRLLGPQRHGLGPARRATAPPAPAPGGTPAATHDEAPAVLPQERPGLGASGSGGVLFRVPIAHHACGCQTPPPLPPTGSTVGLGRSGAPVEVTAHHRHVASGGQGLRLSDAGMASGGRGYSPRTLGGSGRPGRPTATRRTPEATRPRLPGPVGATHPHHLRGANGESIL